MRKPAAKKAAKKTAKKKTSKRTAPARRKKAPAKPAEVKVTAAKGRPMLTWVGKRPLSRVTAFPAQHIETFDPTGSLRPRRAGASSPAPGSLDLWKDWPDAYPSGGLIFHGDNKEVLAHLLANGFRGKVNLIYIDPPFDSAADYVRKVNLRGAAGNAKVEGESYTLGEQIQYTDIWANDNYLQFMYERLLLLRELLTEGGSLYLHSDWHKSHQLRCLLDEVFGPQSFQAEIVWQRTDPHNDAVSRYGRIHDLIFWYSRGETPVYNAYAIVEKLSPAALKEYSLVERPDGNVVPYDPAVPLEGRRFKLDDCTVKGSDPNRRFTWRGARPSPNRVWPFDDAGMEAALNRGHFHLRDASRGAARCRKSYLDERRGQLVQDIWTNCGRMKGGSDFPTRKPEPLADRIIRASSNPGDIVLDCFAGSGTTAAAAQRMGCRWIACDINKGAVQTTSKRIHIVIEEQRKQHSQGKFSDIGEHTGAAPPAQLDFSVWRVNDYDLTIQHNEAVNLACEHVGVQRTRSDTYFDGTRGKALVKLIPFNRPLTPLDLEELKRELDARPEEERAIILICLGIETAALAWIEDWNRLRRGKNAVNRIDVIELRTDPKYGKFFQHKPAVAKVSIARKKDKLVIEVEDFLSPTIIERLQQQAAIVTPKIDDWRAMVDCVLIDTAYDGEVFNIALSDIPEKKTDLVSGRYELAAPKGKTTVAIKIIDMLGEEVLTTAAV